MRRSVWGRLVLLIFASRPAFATDTCYGDCNPGTGCAGDPCAAAYPEGPGYCAYSPDPTDTFDFPWGTAFDSNSCVWECGYCPTGETCVYSGPHASYNGWVCECPTPTSPCNGTNCGAVTAGSGACQQTFNCACSVGTCSNGTCSCSPVSCSYYVSYPYAGAYNCGMLPNQCGNNLECGCPNGQYCSDTLGTIGQCVNSCVPKTCSTYASSSSCGNLPDGCGGNINCGCSSGNTCTNSVCCPTNPNPPSCSAVGATCGTVTSGPAACGNSVNCGTCANGRYCVNNVCMAPPPTPALGGGPGALGLASPWGVQQYSPPLASVRSSHEKHIPSPPRVPRVGRLFR
jgi:hypothetical protein